MVETTNQLVGSSQLDGKLLEQNQFCGLQLYNLRFLRSTHVNWWDLVGKNWAMWPPPRFVLTRSTKFSKVTCSHSCQEESILG